MPQFGVRLSDELTDLAQVAAATGRSAAAVQRDLADGYLARDLSRNTAEQMVANLASAGFTAEVFTQGLGWNAVKGGNRSALGALGGGALPTRSGLSGLSKGGLSAPRGLPGLGLGRAPAKTILGPPAPAEPETARVSAAPPVELPPPVALPASVDLPPISLPPPMSDAELMPSLKAEDPAALPPPQALTTPPQRSPRAPVSRPIVTPPDDRRAAVSGQPVTRPRASSAPASAAPAGHATHNPPAVSSPPPRISTPLRSMPLVDASAASLSEPRNTRVPWIVAGTLVVLSGVFVAWTWSGRDAAIQALRHAESAYAKGDYVKASVAAERARGLGAQIWADRLVAASAAGPHLDRAEALLIGDDLDGAQAALKSAQGLAPKDARTLQVRIDLMRQRAAVAPTVQPIAPVSIAPVSIAPASTAPASTAPVAIAPASVAPPSAASAIPTSLASVAPAAIASVAPITAAPVVEPAPKPDPPEVRFARPPSRPTRDRSTVARLKIVSDLVGEIVVDGARVSVAVPGWIEVAPGRRRIAIRAADGTLHGLRAVKAAAGRRGTVRLRAK